MPNGDTSMTYPFPYKTQDGVDGFEFSSVYINNGSWLINLSAFYVSSSYYWYYPAGPGTDGQVLTSGGGTGPMTWTNAPVTTITGPSNLGIIVTPSTNSATINPLVTGSGHFALSVSPTITTPTFNTNFEVSNTSVGVTVDPSFVTENYSLFLPATQGAAGQVLVSGGEGEPQVWTDPGSGGLGSVTYVGLSLPGFLDVTPSAITTAGTFDVTAITSGAANPDDGHERVVLDYEPSIDLLTVNGGQFTAVGTGGTALYVTGGANIVQNLNVSGLGYKTALAGIQGFCPPINTFGQPTVDAAADVVFYGGATVHIAGPPLGSAHVTFVDPPTGVPGIYVGLQVDGGIWTDDLTTSGDSLFVGATEMEGDVSIGTSLTRNELEFLNTGITYSNATDAYYYGIKGPGTFVTNPFMYTGMDLQSGVVNPLPPFNLIGRSTAPMISWYGTDGVTNPLLNIGVLTLDEVPSITFGSNVSNVMQTSWGDTFWGTTYKDGATGLINLMTIGVGVADASPDGAPSISLGQNVEGLPVTQLSISDDLAFGPAISLGRDNLVNKALALNCSLVSGVGTLHFFDGLPFIPPATSNTETLKVFGGLTPGMTATGPLQIVSTGAMNLTAGDLFSFTMAAGAFNVTMADVAFDVEMGALSGNFDIGDQNISYVYGESVLSYTYAGGSITTTMGGGNIIIEMGAGDFVFTSTGALEITAPITSLTGGLTVSGETTLTGDVVASGGVEVTGLFSALAESNFTGLVTTEAEVNVGGALTVEGASVFAGLVTSNIATITTGLATFNGGVVVNGGSSLNGLVAIAGDLTVSGTSTITGAVIYSGSLTVTGIFTALAESITNGLSTLNGGIVVNGGSSLNGLVALTGDLTASGLVTLAGDLTSAGLVTLNGTSITNGLATFNGGITGFGGATLTGALTVSGVATMGDIIAGDIECTAIDADLIICNGDLAAFDCELGDIQCGDIEAGVVIAATVQATFINAGIITADFSIAAPTVEAGIFLGAPL